MARPVVSNHTRKGVVVLSCLTFLAALGGGVIVRRTLARWTPRDVQDAKPHVARTGTELVMVYIGRASCTWCNRAGFAEEVRAAKQALAQQAASRGARFVAQGVALDNVLADGFDHLKKLGPFDEISVGGGWVNEFAFRYFWSEIPGPPATPTILVLRRWIYVPDTTSTVPVYSIGEAELLVRKVGLFEIQRWVALGSPSPWTADRDSTDSAYDEAS